MENRHYGHIPFNSKDSQINFACVIYVDDTVDKTEHK